MDDDIAHDARCLLVALEDMERWVGRPDVLATEVETLGEAARRLNALFADALVEEARHTHLEAA